MGVLTVSDLAYARGSQMIFQHITMTLEKGAVAGMIGPSGVGKTTLLHLLAGVEKPVCGTIRIDDDVLTSATVFVPPEKRRVGMVFQDYAVFPHMTVEQNLVFGMKGVPKKEQGEKLGEMLDMMRLEPLRKRYPHELSGGQQQRVAIARTLLGNIRLLLLDEPFSNLDRALSEQIVHDMIGYIQRHQITTLLVSHNIADINMMCERYYCLCEMGIMPFEPLPQSSPELVAASA